jgi:hypothetical protein
MKEALVEEEIHLKIINKFINKDMKTNIKEVKNYSFKKV